MGCWLISLFQWLIDCGLRSFKHRRGRSLSSAATCSRCVSVQTQRSVPFGKYWRSSPLVFSLLPRCQGECGSAKYTLRPVRRSIRAWWNSSLPWSQVSVAELPPASGGTGDECVPDGLRGMTVGSGTRTVNRSLRSTRVAMAERCPEPTIRSPSQCPTCGGTQRLEGGCGSTHRGALLQRAVSPRPRPRRRRYVRPVRRLSGDSTPKTAVDRFVDGLGTHASGFRGCATQPPADLRRRPAPGELARDHARNAGSRATRRVLGRRRA